MAHVYGKYRAEVVDRDDPAQNGRLLVASNVLGDAHGGVGHRWATACVPLGFALLPEVGSTVWIEFEEGDILRPLWTGCAWPSSLQAPPVGPGVHVDAGGGVWISSPTAIELIAPAVRVSAEMMEGSGILKGATLVATIGVVSPSYTPGVGNLQ